MSILKKSIFNSMLPSSTLCNIFKIKTKIMPRRWVFYYLNEIYNKVPQSFHKNRIPILLYCVCISSRIHGGNEKETHTATGIYSHYLSDLIADHERSLFRGGHPVRSQSDSLIAGSNSGRNNCHTTKIAIFLHPIPDC